LGATFFIAGVREKSRRRRERNSRSIVKWLALFILAAAAIAVLGRLVARKLEYFFSLRRARAREFAPRQFSLPGETAAGWKKNPLNPVLGAGLGTCFDAAVMVRESGIAMFFSWRPNRSIALVSGDDGIHWSRPVIVLGPDPSTGWEEEVNRPSVLRIGDQYFMWYTGQTPSSSCIGLAVSDDGNTWRRSSNEPVMKPTEAWEQQAVMCPSVLWDESESIFKMWYSAGDQHEPNAIGYATSRDGIDWSRHDSNPIFRPSPDYAWEQHKVAGCSVVRDGIWYVMFYIGFHDEQTAMISIARSRDGISNWERHPRNPVIRPGERAGSWDYAAVYRPAPLRVGAGWMLWYNGRAGMTEQIGLASHAEGELWPS
jgi:predicted GH43/DUF377 family glycosyl hydrolase